MNKETRSTFIEAQESAPMIWFFKWYSWFLAKRRFHSICIRNEYNRSKDTSTLYILNHHYWWDGLIPLILNEFIFKQHARGVMEDKQMLKFPFFSKIGAFSINRSNPTSALKSLAYGADWLRNSNNSLYLFPEGKFSQAHEPIKIESGITKILEWVPNIEIVNISIHISYQASDRPNLFIDITKPILLPTAANRPELVEGVNQLMNDNLSRLRHDSLHNPGLFQKLH
jgi:chlorobactene lauroyltransferase